MSPTLCTSVEPPPTYWTDARQPLACVVFLLPLLVVYELGLILLSRPLAQQARGGADLWLRSCLGTVGDVIPQLLPVTIVVALLVWHRATGRQWRITRETLLGMLAESLLFALLLVVLGQLQHLLFLRWGLTPLSWGEAASTTVSRTVSFIGAGLYEETLFRLALLPLVYGLARLIKLPSRISAAVAVVATSLTFSLAHYVDPTAGVSLPLAILQAGHEVIGDPQLWYGFAFRATAGGFFAVLFVLRGFGITVGAHAAYDLLVGIVLSA